MSKYDVTINDWERLIEKAQKRLENSKKCFEYFGDDDSKRWIEEDTKKLNELENKFRIVKQRIAKKLKGAEN